MVHGSYLFMAFSNLNSPVRVFKVESVEIEFQNTLQI